MIVSAAEGRDVIGVSPPGEAPGSAGDRQQLRVSQPFTLGDEEADRLVGPSGLGQHDHQQPLPDGDQMQDAMNQAEGTP